MKNAEEKLINSLAYSGRSGFLFDVYLGTQTPQQEFLLMTDIKSSHQ